MSLHTSETAKSRHLQATETSMHMQSTSKVITSITQITSQCSQENAACWNRNMQCR